MKFLLLTKWRDKGLLCCCPVKNKCMKDHNCEELEFTLDIYVYLGIYEAKVVKAE